MKKIRKIWIGKGVKEDSMSWEVGQSVRLGRDPNNRGTIDEIVQAEEGYDIFVKQGKTIVPWKHTTMNVTVEYDLIY